MEKTKKELPELRKLQDTFKLVVPKEVEEKIRHLCRCCPTVEWSGKLFYKTEGSIATKDLVITCVDIYVMDIGTGGYTEFDETPDFFGYMVDKDLMDCNIGLIHSHNVMATFFSGTDTSTLQEEGNDNNHFVSLIVNNAGKYTAAVTRKVTTTMNIVATDSFRTFDDSEVHIEGSKTWQQTNTVIEYYMLDIEKAEVPSVFNELDIRLNEIRAAKAKKEEEAKKAKPDPWRGQSYIDRPKGLGYFDQRLDAFNKHSFTQLSLFDDKELGEKIVANEGQQLESKPSEKLLEEEEVVDFRVTDEMVEDIVTQLITGSILISSKSKVDLDKFVLTMETLFDKRFPDDPTSYLYYYWMENFIDFLFMETIPDGLTTEAEKNCEFELGMAVRDRISKYSPNPGTNKYIDVIVELLDHKIDF